ncbi:MAG: DUF1653 domain-containing protein [Alkalimonas sp.]|nr:DUF1653 domain-containing protein [Alkalimonas sp.]
MNASSPNPVIEPGYYQHYKGPYYQVLDVARHSETEEWLVIYRPMYGEQALWARPVAMFNELVDLQGQQVPRFRFLGNELPA